MRTPTLFYGLIYGTALATLSLSTLPVGAQTRHYPPVTLDTFLMPDAAPTAQDGDDGDEASANTEFIKAWRRIHGDKNGATNPALILRARQQAARLKGGGGGAHGEALGRKNSDARAEGGTPTGPTLPAPGNNGGWQFVGPSGIVPPQSTLFGFGPFNCSGRVSAAAFDPVNPNTFYIASATGGIWKTQDAGATWLPLTDYTLGNANNTFSSLTVDPNHNNVIWAGSGDFDYGNSPGFGLFKSTDAGATWAPIPQTALPSGLHVIRKVVVDPNNSQHVLVALGRDWKSFSPPGSPPGNLIADPGSGTGSIYQTLDGGTHWTDVADFNSFVSNIVYNMDNSILYASVDSLGIYQSTDNGMTWNGPLGGVGLTTPIDTIDNRLDVAASPTDPNTVYVLSAADEAVYKSADAGVTWTDITNNLTDSYGLGVGTGSAEWGQAVYDFYLAAAPATFTVGGPGVEGGPGTVTSDVLYVGLLGITHSTNGGGYWADVTQTYTGNDTLHTDQHCLAFNPNNPNQFLVGSDGGVFLCNYSPDTDSVDVKGLNNNLGITDLYWSAANPNDPNDVILSSQDNGNPHSRNGATSWTLYVPGDGMCSAFTNTAPLVQYQSAYSGGLFLQADDGFVDDPYNPSVFEIDVPDNVAFFTPVATTANSEFIISAGQQFDVMDHGPTIYPAKAGTWNKKPYGGATLLGPNGNNDQAVCVGASPANEFILFAGMNSGAVWVSQDKGATAFEVDGANNGSPQPLPQLPVTSVAGGYKNVNRVYATLGVQTNDNISHVWRCDNVTAVPPVWVPIDGRDALGNPGPNALPEVAVTSLVVVPHDNEQTLYVATDAGVFVTYDGGADWQSFNQVPNTTSQLPNVIVTRLSYNPGTGTLDADTWGRGLWRCVVGNDTPLLIRPNMPGFKGSKGTLSARVDLFQGGLIDVAPDFEEPTAVGYPYRFVSGKPYGTPYPFKYLLQPTETRANTLTPAGYFNANISSQGIYDVMLTVPRFLRKRIRNVNTAITPLTTVNLTLGDCAGPVDPATGLYGPPDNIIDFNDYFAIEDYIARAAAGLVSKYNKGPLDVNGDGVVDIKDLNIVRAILIAYGPIQGD